MTLHRITSIIPTGRALFRKGHYIYKFKWFHNVTSFRSAVTYLCTMLRPVHFLFCSITSQVIGFPLMAWRSAGGAFMYVFLRMILGRQMHYGDTEAPEYTRMSSSRRRYTSTLFPWKRESSFHHH